MSALVREPQPPEALKVRPGEGSPLALFLPGIGVCAGLLLARLAAPYATTQERLLVVSSLVLVAAAAVTVVQRVRRIGDPLKVLGSLAVLASVVIAAHGVSEQLDRRIDVTRVCAQATASVATSDDLTAISRATVGEYVNADIRAVDLDRVGLRAFELGTVAFTIRISVEPRPDQRTTAQEEARLREQQAQLAAACAAAPDS